MTIDSAYIDGLLATTDQLFSNIHSFECKPHNIPGKSHTGVAITYQDLQERREDFINELKNTMHAWVYSKSRYKKIFEEALKERGNDFPNANAFMSSLVRDKFRKGFPQGQFGELLLFNLIQHFFLAAPLLRKMPILTSPAVERHGADAIHYRPVTGVHKIFLGEAKSYTSKYKFSEALGDAVDSVLSAHKKFQKELGQYVYDDFIDEELRTVAKDLKNNKLSPVEIELVCIVSYEENGKKVGLNEKEIKSCVETIVKDRIGGFDVSKFSAHCAVTLGRLHLFVMPVWDFDDLLVNFES